MKFDNSLFIEDSRFDAEKYDHFFQFKDCKSIDEYINKYLNKGTSDIDINESAYQYMYDESNDWYRQEFTSTDVQNAFAIGALWMRKLMEKKNNL